ncbi:hypothetical protein [uncultured Kordia sp.]|uniref:hypothetical protein n=1 Tax=uncultured Kordia sp. TaxID=507699 RepID=UPI002621E341|nr:hypothetical protein [uncultured Kordia sp.]
MVDNWNDVASDISEAMRAWLQELTQITCSNTENNEDEVPKVLFVLDNDYGELTTIMYLVSGQNYFRKSKVLLSARLYEKNKNILPQNIDLWTTEEDVLNSLKTYQPDVLVFAAGYLIPVHNLLTNEALERVCQAATDQKIQVVTADPFLGLVSEWSPKGLKEIISIDIPTGSNEHLIGLKRQADQKLHTELAAANSFLRAFPHLYPTYTDMKGIAAFPSDEKNKSFFNEKLVIPAELQSLSSKDKPHWMFIISEVDFQTQTMHVGAGKFVAMVWNLLTQGANLGRKMIFLGPSALINMLRSMSTTPNENICLFNFGAFDRVMSLLLTAEYTFYWNVVSHTILIQLWNGKSVILFDKGHLARSVSNLYERVIAWYYQGWEPNYFDQTQKITLEGLADFVNDHTKQKERLMKAYTRAPSPAALFNSLLQVE